TPLDGRQPLANNFHLAETSFYEVIANLSALYLAGSPDELNFNFLLKGQTVPVVQVPRGLTTVNVQGPGFSESIKLDGQTELRLANLQRPGNYLIRRFSDDSLVGGFTANLPPEECTAARVPVEEITPLFGDDGVVPMDRRAKLRDALKGHLSEP